MPSFPKRKNNGTSAMMDNCVTGACTQNENESKFEEASMHPVVPVIKKISFMGVSPCIDIYTRYSGSRQ